MFNLSACAIMAIVVMIVLLLVEDILSDYHELKDEMMTGFTLFIVRFIMGVDLTFLWFLVCCYIVR